MTTDTTPPDTLTPDELEALRMKLAPWPDAERMSVPGRVLRCLLAAYPRPAEGKSAEALLLPALNEALDTLREIRDDQTWPLRGRFNEALDRLAVAASKYAVLAAQAQPVPAVPSDAELIAAWGDALHTGGMGLAAMLIFARALLARYGSQTGAQPAEGAPAWLQRRIATSSTSNPDGPFQVTLYFASLADMQAAHREIVAAQPTERPAP